MKFTYHEKFRVYGTLFYITLVARIASSYTLNLIVSVSLLMYVGLSTTVDPNLSSAIMVNFSPQRQQNILVVSQPSSLVSIISDTHTTTSPVTTLSVVECLTTSSSVVTSISGQHVPTITTAGVWLHFI